MITLTNENNTIGSTYSNSNYLEYKENKNIFEEVIDALMLDQYSDEPELTNFIKSLPSADKRMAILSLLDSDNNMWIKLKSLIENNNISKVEQIKDVVLMLREYVKIAEVEKKKFGEVMTPLELVKEMLATLPEEVWSNPDLKWLDPANGTGPYPIMVIYKLMKGLSAWEPNEELRYRHIIENMIYVCELQPKNMFLYLCAIDPKDEYKCNVYTGSFLDDGFDKHMKEVWNIDKYDVIIGNPPYKNGLHITFFNKSFDILEKNGYIIFIHPSTPFLNRKPSREDEKTKKIKNVISENESCLKLIDGNKIFAAGFLTPLSITYIRKTKDRNIKIIYSHIDDSNNTINIYENLDSVYIHGDNRVLSIKEKIFLKMVLSLDDKLFRNGNISNKYIKLCRISGHPPKSGEKIINPDFFQLIYKKNEKDIDSIITSEPIGIRSDGNQFNELIINSDSEIKNIHKYLMTKFSRFCLSFYKNSANILSDLKAVPYMDFSQEWDDNKLFEYFELNESEIKFINDFIPNWYSSDFE